MMTALSCVSSIRLSARLARRRYKNWVSWPISVTKACSALASIWASSQHLSGRGLESLQLFTHWLGGIAKLAECDPVKAVRDLIHGVDYESLLSETSPSPKAAEMRMKNVNTLFG